MKGLKVTFKQGDKAATWDETNPYKHTHYRVTVTRNGKRAEFDFWGSISDYQEQKDPTPDEMVAAWAGDALAGRDSFEDFCGEFGYDTDSRKAEQTYHACQKAYTAAQRIGLSENELDELYSKV